MLKIKLDASRWKTPLDFVRALLDAIGAPEWNGTSIQAILDAMIWDGASKAVPPYAVHIANIRQTTSEVVDEVILLQQCLQESCEEFLRRKGRSADVRIEIEE